jgi:carbamoylphosphate synthase large subunit
MVAVVIHNPSQALAAAETIGYPLVIKPNIGGSGAGIIRFEGPEQLQAAVDEKQLYFGIDHVALVQELPNTLALVRGRLNFVHQALGIVGSPCGEPSSAAE